MFDKAHRCYICNLLYTEADLVDNKCPKDGTKVHDATHTKRGQTFLKMRNEVYMREHNPYLKDDTIVYAQ